MATEMVMAIGDHGAELARPEDAVEIGAMPLGADNMAIPATVQFMAKLGGHVPTRVRRILRPSTRLNPTPFPYVEFDCTPFVRYELDSGPVHGDWMGCHVRNAGDAANPIFSGLTGLEQSRIRAALP